MFTRTLEAAAAGLLENATVVTDTSTGANVRIGKSLIMSEQELKEFIARMAELRAANTATAEKARAFLQEEGYLTESGKVAEPYVKAVGGKS